MLKNNKKIIIFIIILITLSFIIYKMFIKKENLIEEINTNILENTEENDISNKEKNNANEKIIVYITGEISNPGLYELEENSRIADCIEKAGGTKEKADITNINLATILEDGEKIYIPAKDEENAQEKTNNKSEEKNNNNITSKTVIENNVNKKNTKVNINTATQTELESLPGIGSSIATKIIEYRKENGKFKNIEEIKKINGIGENKYKKIRELIKV